MATSKPTATTSTPNLTLHAAQLASAAAIAAATRLKVPQNIAIVDTSLQLLHFQRMPGAKLTSISIAIDKAFTAAGHRLPTHVYKENVWPGGVAYGLNNSNGGRFMVVGGGLPIMIDGAVVGGIGCSTGTPDQDRVVAQAGVDAVVEFAKKSASGEKAKL